MKTVLLTIGMTLLMQHYVHAQLQIQSSHAANVDIENVNQLKFLNSIANNDIAPDLDGVTVMQNTAWISSTVLLGAPLALLVMDSELEAGYGASGILAAAIFSGISFYASRKLIKPGTIYKSTAWGMAIGATSGLFAGGIIGLQQIKGIPNEHHSPIPAIGAYVGAISGGLLGGIIGKLMASKHHREGLLGFSINTIQNPIDYNYLATINCSISIPN